MPRKTDKLTGLLAEQQALLQALQQEASVLEDDSVLAENERLQAALTQSTQTAQALTQENAALKKDLEVSKRALFAKMAQEKLLVFERRQRKIDALYYQAEAGVTNQLNAYESGCRQSIEQTAKAIAQYGTEEYRDISNKLHALNREFEERRQQVEAYKRAQLQTASATNSRIGETLKNEPLREAEKRAGMKQKSLETFVGLNILSKAGILLFLVGIIALGRFAYTQLTDTFKGMMIFLLGGVLLGVGELFHKKEKTVFSTALISGGVAVLYAAVATGLFAFHLYSNAIAFALCMGVTALAIALSQQLKSEVVCAFGAVGGYLPVVASYMMGFGKLAADATFLPVSAVYFCLLAAILFVMTYQKKWYVAQYIGYGLHLAAIGGIAACVHGVRLIQGYSYAPMLAVIFAVVSFVLYLLMPAAKIISRKSITIYDIVLLSMNTVSGAISVSLTVRHLPHVTKDSATGVVFLLFTVIYAVLMAVSVREKKPSTNNTAVTTIVSLAALVFSMMTTPFLFGMTYAPIAWAAEGALIAILAMEKRLIFVEFAGLACLLPAIFGTGILYDDDNRMFLICFAVVLAALWSITLSGLTQRQISSGKRVMYIILEHIAMLFSLGFVGAVYEEILYSPAVVIDNDFLNAAVMLLAVLAAGCLLRVGALRNKASEVVSAVIGILLMPATVIGMDILLEYKQVCHYYGGVAAGWQTANLIILLVINAAVVLYFAYAVARAIEGLKAPAWLYTTALSVAVLAQITAILMVQFSLNFSSVWLSALYIAAACVLLVIGFRRSFTVVRSGGLVLILVAFAKLCFVDTRALDSTWKIAAYFAFGALLIAISYFYQRFSKKLEAEAMQMISDDADVQSLSETVTVSEN